MTTTTNGMPALQDSSNPLVDYFFKIGGSRGNDVISLFQSAFEYDPIFSLKLLLWTRDARGGAGERQSFKDILQHLEQTNPEMLEKIFDHIVKYGRYDDLLIFNTKHFEEKAFAIIKKALDDGNKLCAKWMPREKSSKKKIANKLIKYLNISHRDYRKLLSSNTDVVETKMCSNQFRSINFSKVPSVAAARYQKAFKHNANLEYQLYIEGLKLGITKINASTVYPYDIIKSIKYGEPDVADEQWKALPNYMNGTKMLPIIDVSGSMYQTIATNSNLSCIDVAISLGLYCADKNTGPFANKFITFSEEPELVTLAEGTLFEKYSQIERSVWGMNTNFESVFDLILNDAIENNLSDDDIPEVMICFSDMQFDDADSDDTAYQMITQKFNDAGYKVPRFIFWNLNSYDNVPVKCDEDGTAMVSGFSPVLLKSVLSSKSLTSESIMYQTINVERYNIF
jgi:hypothetical protein